MSASIRPPVETGSFYTTTTPVEKHCDVGDPLIIEWKGTRYRTLMRGAKVETIATNLLGQKARLAILHDTSFILTDMPSNYAAAGFEFNSSLTVRFLRNGKVYSFKTTLMRVHNQPPVLVLEYPEMVEYHNMRSDERMGMIFPVQIAENGGAVIKAGAILDISASGVRIGLESREGINVGARLNLSFTLPNGTSVRDLASSVRNISEEGGKYLMGSIFLRHEPAVRAFCYECASCLE